ncbi:hypothetical protein [Paraburkholderia xenovorans]
MKSTTKFLFGTAVVICTTAVFFRGSHPAPENAVEKTPVAAATTNSFSTSSAAYRETVNFNQWLAQNKKLESARNSTSPADQINLVGRLGAEGMARLPTAVLEAYMPLMKKILDGLNDKECSDFVTGRMSITDFSSRTFPLLESLTDTERKAFFSITKSAINARLDNLPFVLVSQENAKEALLKVAASLPADESNTFLHNLVNLRTASNTDTCATVRTMFSKGVLLPEPFRGNLARLILSGKDGRGNF